MENGGAGIRHVLVGDVVLAEPDHVVGGQEVALGVLDARRVRVVVGEVDARVDQQLRGDGRTPLARGQGDRSSEVAPCAVAGDGEPGSVTAERADAVGGPLSRSETVLETGRELVLGSQPVVDANDHGVDVAAQQPAVVVVRVQVADDEAATVEEHDRRHRPLVRRPVDADRDRARRTWDLLVVDRCDVGQGCRVTHVDGGEAEGCPRLLGAAAGQGWRS